MYIIAGVVGLYLLLVIPAGIAVLISQRRFRNSPDHDAILSIIQRYKHHVRGWSADQVADLVKCPQREVIEKDGVAFSVDLRARAVKKGRSYEVSVSVGKLRPVTIGHAERMKLTFAE